MVIHNFCPNCLSGHKIPKNKFVHETENLSIEYNCGSLLECKDYDPEKRHWRVSLMLKCKPRRDFTWDDESDYEY